MWHVLILFFYTSTLYGSITLIHIHIFVFLRKNRQSLIITSLKHIFLKTIQILQKYVYVK